MIKVKKISCKNFLSYGNSLTTLELDTHKSTLIRGKNGHGKSAWMDLLLYALYGRPYRNIGKPQLINSINKGGMMVELEFCIGITEYRIVRGMKPNIFDIFKDGMLIAQDAAMRDYQGFLETQVLKMNEKTFKQIAVLGSASYVPFMQLNTSQRRELVESILDIEVFSRMNAVLKDRIATTKEEYKSIETKVSLKKLEAVAQEKLIKVILGNTESRLVEQRINKDTLNAELLSVSTEKDKIESLIKSHNETNPEFDRERYEFVTQSISNYEKEKATAIKKSSSIHSITECSMCFQSVSSDHVKHVENSLSEMIGQIDTALEELKIERKKLEIHRTELYRFQERSLELMNELKDKQKDMNSLRDRISTIDVKIDNINSNTSDVAAEREKLKEIGASAVKLMEYRVTLSEEKHIQEVAAQLLKDTGIKTAVVKEYLPVLNTLINKYLVMFDFFVDFTLDESFAEVIKSRGRDIFTYSSFSEGEKRRIDFAILMAFRQLAALKNSAKTNVLILDEIVDGAFDLEARACFNDLLGTIPDSNVLVISHADANTDQYDRVIHVEKKGDFSTYTVVE